MGSGQRETRTRVQFSRSTDAAAKEIGEPVADDGMSPQEADVPDLPELVALLYRADWTRLSLSARATQRRDKDVHLRLRDLAQAERDQELGPVPGFLRPRDDSLHDGPEWPETQVNILLAPGGRYRVSHSDRDPARVCDGESEWDISDGTAHRVLLPGPPFRGLLRPRWLLACYDLSITATTEAAGRPARLVTATPRPLTTRTGPGDYHLLDRVEVLVDAELGILLRRELILEGRTLELTELHDVVVDPPQAADQEMFRPPPGMPREEHQGPSTFVPEGFGWQAAAAVAGAAASAMGFVVRHAPHRPPRRADGDAEPDMPLDAYDMDPAAADGEPLGDELVNLLHRTGLPAQDFAASLHEWIDVATVVGAFDAFRSSLPQPADGILGPDQVWEAAGERAQEAGTAHRTGRLAVSMPGRYRIDQLTGGWRPRCRTIVSDGERTRKLYRDRVATGPATPLRKDLATLADPAWLLYNWVLRLTGQVSVAGRRGYRILARAPEPTRTWANTEPFTLIEVIVDAELALVLRRTHYAGDRPAARSELRNLTTPAGPAEFDIHTAPGLREVTDPGGLLADLDLPVPLREAGTAVAMAAGGLIAGAGALTGWLAKRRARPDADDRGS
jgi:hypothetical protein